MSRTPKLQLPYLAAGQAQKHVTLNESLRILDAVVQLSVLTRQSGTPPTSAQPGERYLVAAGATGAWSGGSGQIASFEDGAWKLLSPMQGWLLWVADEDILLVYDGAVWGAVRGAMQHIPMAGINATADTTNRLVVASPATLLNHDGGGHQLKINKAQTGATASLLFQTGYSGRAEMGTAGSDAFSIKTSADGNTWSDVLRTEGTDKIWLGPHRVEAGPAGSYGSIEMTLGVPGERHSFIDFHASDLQPDASGRLIRWATSAGDLDLVNFGTGHIRLNVLGSGEVRFSPGGIDRIGVNAAGNVVPMLDNAYSLGESGKRFSSLWAANGVIQTSDLRDKVVEGPMGAQAAQTLVDTVEPVLFKWRSGSAQAVVHARRTVPMNPADPSGKKMETVECRDVQHPGKRQHAGFLAQDIKAALDKAGLDFAVWGLEDAAKAESRQWLRPDQLIPVLWTALRETRAEVKRLRDVIEHRPQDARAGSPRKGSPDRA